MKPVNNLIIEKYDSEEDWLEGRTGCISGSKLGGLLSKRDKKPLKGYYSLIAERIAIPANMENVMDRGHRLEDDAIDRFEKETGIKIIRDLVIWRRKDDPNIIVSPDGYTKDLKTAVEIKCLNSASHIEAILTNQIPAEYKEQVIQYFVVSEKLETLYFIMFDPRLPNKDYLCFTFKREEMQEEIAEYLELEREVLKQIEVYEKLLTF